MSEAKEKMELKDKILLAIPDIGAMQPHRLDGGECMANLNAIRQLRIEGLVTAMEDTCGGFIKFELTDPGKLRKAELVRLRKRSVVEKSGDAVSRGLRFVRPSVGRIVEGVIIAVVSSAISGVFGFWLGRTTATDIPDKATEKVTDNYKQEHSDNVTIRLD